MNFRVHLLLDGERVSHLGIHTKTKGAGIPLPILYQLSANVSAHTRGVHDLKHPPVQNLSLPLNDVNVMFFQR